VGPNDRDFVPREDIAQALEGNVRLTLEIAREATEARVLVRGALQSIEGLKADIKEITQQMDALESMLQRLENRLQDSSRQIEGIASTQEKNAAAEASLRQTTVTSRYTLWGLIVTAIIGLVGTVITLIYTSQKGGKEDSGRKIMDPIANIVAFRPPSSGSRLQREEPPLR
jgi:chromosome segregation ATPase